MRYAVTGGQLCAGLDPLCRMLAGCLYSKSPWRLSSRSFNISVNCQLCLRKSEAVSSLVVCVDEEAVPGRLDV